MFFVHNLKLSFKGPLSLTQKVQKQGYFGDACGGPPHTSPKQPLEVEWGYKHIKQYFTHLERPRKLCLKIEIEELMHF